MNLINKLCISVVLCLGLGFLSGFFAGSAVTEWYEALNKPFFQPPPWLFGPAWTILYILIGIAFALVWDSEDSAFRTKAMTFFVVQFILNLIWSPIFFKLERPALALGVIILLLLLIVKTISLFAKVDRRSRNLMIPYLLWVCFATVLNASIVYLN